MELVDLSFRVLWDFVHSLVKKKKTVSVRMCSTASHRNPDSDRLKQHGNLLSPITRSLEKSSLQGWLIQQQLLFSRMQVSFPFLCSAIPSADFSAGLGARWAWQFLVS